MCHDRGDITCSTTPYKHPLFTKTWVSHLEVDVAAVVAVEAVSVVAVVTVVAAVAEVVLAAAVEDLVSH